MRGPGRFGPSRKKEAAARRVGCYELWVLNAAVSGDARGRKDVWGVVRAAGRAWARRRVSAGEMKRLSRGSQVWYLRVSDTRRARRAGEHVQRAETEPLL